MDTETSTPQRIGRRDALRRGAILGGALVWAAPAVQTLGARGAFADSHVTPFDCCSDPNSGDRISTLTLRYSPTGGSAPQRVCMKVYLGTGGQGPEFATSAIVDAAAAGGFSHSLTIDFPCGGQAKNETYVEICDVAENETDPSVCTSGSDCDQLSYDQFHTSCSTALFPGQRFGETILTGVTCC